MVTGGEDGHINVSNVGIGKIIGVFKGHVIDGDGDCSIEDLEFLSLYVHVTTLCSDHCSLPCVASASLDKTVQIWDLNTLQTRTTLKLSVNLSTRKLILISLGRRCSSSNQLNESTCLSDMLFGWIYLCMGC